MSNGTIEKPKEGMFDRMRSMAAILGADDDGIIDFATYTVSFKKNSKEIQRLNWGDRWDRPGDEQWPIWTTEYKEKLIKEDTKAIERRMRYIKERILKKAEGSIK